MADVVAGSAPGDRLFQAGFEHLRRTADRDAEGDEPTPRSPAFHPVRESCTYAYALLQAQGDAAVPVAEELVRATLAAQEVQDGHLHEGNFRWMHEDQGVTDLNSVQFVLEQLLPLYVEHGHRFDGSLRTDLLAAFHLAGWELERLDVDVSYTNITLLDTLNTVLLGQVLGDERLRRRGVRRLDEWIAATNRSGAVPEYNSPTYTAVDLGALAELAERAEDPALAVKARLMEERLWLHTASHYHHPTAQLAGPHSRAYHNDVTGGICLLKLTLYRCLGDERLLHVSGYAQERQVAGDVRIARHPYHLPDYLERLLTSKPTPYQVREITDVDQGVDVSTWMTPTYALGTVSASSYPQADRLMLHYRRDSAPGYGVLYSRYLFNEKSLGSFYHASDRSHSNNLSDEGQFWGFQHANKSIALYGLLPQSEQVASLKTEVFVLDHERLDEVWVDEERVQTLPSGLPRQLDPLQAVLIADDDVFIAVRPLEPSNLGRDAPIVLQTRGSELILSIYNYHEGETKAFWEYRSLSGPFYKGNLRAGFVIEVGDRDEFGDFAAFRAHIARGTVSDRTDGHLRSVSYASGAELLEIDVDLYTNRLVDRRLDGVPYRPVPHDSPTAVQATSGELAVGGARLQTTAADSWLLADDQADCWVATHLADEGAPWRLETPAAVVTSGAFGFGKVVVRGCGPVVVEVVSTAQLAPLRIDTDAATVQVTWNGTDVTAACSRDHASGALVLPRGRPGAVSR